MKFINIQKFKLEATMSNQKIKTTVFLSHSSKFQILFILEEKSLDELVLKCFKILVLDKLVHLATYVCKTPLNQYECAIYQTQLQITIYTKHL